METFLEFLHEVLKGIVRALSAHFFQRNILEHKKTTQSRRKQKGGSQKKIDFDNHHPDGRGCSEKRLTLLFFIIFILYTK